ncbi:BRO family protein [Nostoc sp. TCL240-02]|uniref:BRO-N domain-containing protein n=1 Tax=Nostoc sp. TCL240-02 TaxID=2572090 RepID=UPI00157FBA9E|nr:BRO family protein [Nostoc sp. TCL240-02]QKQ75588.1 phage antirepressor [Nostoc sp. TCL240-02]
MSNLTVFQFESHEVRFVGTAIDPWWIAQDICEILEINISQTRRLDDDEKGLRLTQTPSGSQEMLSVNESGLYSLVLGSRKAQAKRFKKWVTSEVLPSIRKTGKYELPQAEQPPILPTPTAQEISDLFDLTLGGAGLDPKLIAGVKLNAIASYNPVLLEAAEIAKSALAIPVDKSLVRPTQLGEKLSAQTGEKWSAIRVNKLLIEQGFQTPNPDKNPAYLPTEKGKDYSQLVLDTAKGRDKTIQSLQWHLSVLEAIEL